MFAILFASIGAEFSVGAHQTLLGYFGGGSLYSEFDGLLPEAYHSQCLADLAYVKPSRALSLAGETGCA
jgi:hypothetical protein